VSLLCVCHCKCNSVCEVVVCEMLVYKVFVCDEFSLGRNEAFKEVESSSHRQLDKRLLQIVSNSLCILSLRKR